jgi:hypothetical protein
MISDQGLGEEGVLEDVRLRKDLLPGAIGVTVHHLGDSRFGIIMLENHAHLEILYHKLQDNLGRPLTEIGNLEIDFTPAPAKYGLKPSRPRPSASYPKQMMPKK